MDKLREPVRSKFHGDDFYEPLVESFAQDLPAVLAKLKKQISENQHEVAKEHCHQMAGASATYGYPTLSRLLQSLEKVLNTNPIEEDTLDTQVKKLEVIFADIGAAFDRRSENEPRN